MRVYFVFECNDFATQGYNKHRLKQDSNNKKMMRGPRPVEALASAIGVTISDKNKSISEENGSHSSLPEQAAIGTGTIHPIAAAQSGQSGQSLELSIVTSLRKLVAEAQAMAQRRAQLQAAIEEQDRAIMQKKAAIDALGGILNSIKH